MRVLIVIFPLVIVFHKGRFTEDRKVLVSSFSLFSVCFSSMYLLALTFVFLLRIMVRDFKRCVFFHCSFFYHFYGLRQTAQNPALDIFKVAKIDAVHICKLKTYTYVYILVHIPLLPMTYYYK
jgi:hypothetical protein